MGCDSDIFFECLVRIIDLNIYVPINVNLEGLAGVGGQRPGIWTRSNFLAQMPNPRAIKIGQKRTNSQPLQLTLGVKSVSTFWGSHIRFFQQKVSGFSSNFWIALNSLTFGNKAIWSYVIWQYEGVAAFVSFRGPSLQRGKQGSTKQNDMFNTTKK